MNGVPVRRDRLRKAMLGKELKQSDLESDDFDFAVNNKMLMVVTPNDVAEQIQAYRDEIGLEHYQ